MKETTGGFSMTRKKHDMDHGDIFLVNGLAGEQEEALIPGAEYLHRVTGKREQVKTVRRINE